MTDSIISHLNNLAAFRSLFQLNPNAICIIDRNHRIISMNLSAEQYLGHKDKVLNTALALYLPSDKQNELSNLLHLAMSDKVQRLDMKLNCADGKQRHLRANLIPALNDMKKVVGVFCVLIDLTTEHYLLNAIAESERHYRQLVEFAPVAVIVHVKGQVLFANMAAERLLMQRLSSGDNLYDLIDPADWTLISERLDQPVGTELPFIEARLRLTDNRTLTVEAGSLQMLYNGLPATLSICRDISAERQAQKAIAFSEARYRMIAENMTDLVSLMDAHGIVKYASPSHFTVLGYQAESLVGLTFSENIHPDDKEIVTEQFILMVQQSDSIKFECRILNAQGQWVWLETCGTVTDSFHSEAKQYLMVSRDITSRKSLEQKLSFMAFHDSLTELPNRRLFTDRLNQSIHEHKRSGQKLAVLFMDLDKFKLINDNLGHDVGDALLIAFAKRVRAVLRDTDTIARFGGDEFVVLLPSLFSWQEAEVVVKRIFLALQEPWLLGEHELKTTSSIGIAIFPEQGQTPVELFKQADMALYHAKNGGRNSYSYVGDFAEDRFLP